MQLRCGLQAPPPNPCPTYSDSSRSPRSPAAHLHSRNGNSCSRAQTLTPRAHSTAPSTAIASSVSAVAPCSPSTSGRSLAVAVAGASGSICPPFLLPTSSRLSSLSHLGRNARRRSRNLAPLVAAAAAAPAGGGAASGAAAPGPRVEEPSTALLLAWFACGNRSLFAAQCLVEVVLALYREGRSFEELQLSLKLATQGGRPLRTRAADTVAAGDEAEQLVTPPLLQAQEEDVLLSWLALVFLTLEELGVARDRDSLLGPGKDPEARGGPPASAGLAAPLGAAVGAGGGGGGVSGMAAGGSVAAGGGSAYLRGMLGYVRQTLGMYDEGQTLAQVAGLQGLVQQASGAASSPFLVLMQQYTRLVLLTVEVVAAAGVPTARPLRPPGTVLRPSSYAGAFSAACSAAADEQQAPCAARGLAVRLLMAFMGAVLGSPWSLGKFVEGVRVAYDQGLAADELFSQLDEQEFVQSGGLLPVAAGPAATGAEQPESEPSSPLSTPPAAAAAPAAASPAPPASGGGAQYQITRALLSTWISLSYMTLAQLGVPYPAASERLGWAWAGFGDPIEAIGMNDFVGNVLRQMAGADPRVVPPLEPQPADADADADASPVPAPVSAPAPAQPISAAGGELAGAEAEAGAGAGAGAAEGGPPGRRRGEALMVRVEDETLPNTSTAFQVLSQQVALVQAVCRDVVTESQG